MNVYWAGSPNYNSGNNGRRYLFPHWTCGGFDGSVATLQNPGRQASAHYVIEGSKVAQLVDEANTAWHCGNRWYNWRSISYELVGWPGNPPSRATLDTCAAMMADASRRYFGGAKLVLGGNVMLHKMVSATSCPGETDIDYLVAKANELLGQGGAPEPEPVQPAPPKGGSNSFTGGTYVCQVESLNVRSAPSLGGEVVASYSRGQTVNLDSWYMVADGYVWGRYTAYSGATRYIAVGRHTGKPESDDYLVLADSAPAPAPAPSGIAARSYTVSCDSLNVRSAPSTSAAVVASYSRGQSVNLDGWSTNADGYRWGRYVAYSGATRYIALGTSDGSQTYLR